MKVLLILYPINPYVNFLIRKKRFPKTKERIASFYQHLINKRYPGFQIVFVLFSKNRNSAKPNMSQLWKGINIKASDIVGSAGVTYRNFRYNWQRPKHADIFALCPEPIDELVIGGFHLWDCVDGFAGYAFQKGLNVVVDEDLTDLFFYMIKDLKSKLSLQIPISREVSLQRKKERLYEVGLLEHARKRRRDKPWFTPI